MLRLLAPGLLGMVFFALWVYCVLDVIATDEVLMRNLPKSLWLVIVIFLPTVGSIAWLGLGRPLYAGFLPGDTTTRPQRRYTAPEDREDWREIDLRRREEDVRRREEELRRREEEGPEPGR